MLEYLEKEEKARKMGVGCNEKCRFKYHQKINELSRTSAFNEFRGLQDRAKQWLCLNNWEKPKYLTKTVSDDEESDFQFDDDTLKHKKSLYLHCHRTEKK